MFSRLGHVAVRRRRAVLVATAILLVWSGIVEAFLSQYHEPVVPYGFKIGLGLVEVALLIAWLAFIVLFPNAIQ